MNEEKIIELIKEIAENTVTVKEIGKKLDSLESRMANLENLREQDIKQNEKIEHILGRLEKGNAHFEKIEARLQALEQTDGKKALKILALIGTSILTIVISFFAAKVGLK